MKFDIKNFTLFSLGLLSSCKAQNADSNNLNAVSSVARSGFSVSLAAPTVTMPPDLKGTLVFQRGDQLQAIREGQKSVFVLRDKFMVVDWNMARDGTKLCFAGQPRDVDFFNAGAYRTYLFSAHYDSKQRVLMAAYGHRAMPQTYSYAGPNWAFQKDLLIVDEAPYIKNTVDGEDDPCFSHVALYNSKTRKRIWDSRKASVP